MKFAEVKPVFKNESLLPNAAFVNGEWIETADRYFEVQDPANQRVIAKLPDQDHSAVDQAAEAANEAFKAYRKTTPYERREWLRRISELLHENVEDLAKIITTENGKPFSEGIAEVNYAADFFDWFADEACKVYGDTIPSIRNRKGRILTIKQPIGVCGIVCPWNFPLAMGARKLAPALAAGCTVVLKPDARAPLSSLALAKLVEIAGIPKGVFNVVLALDPAEIGKKLCEHPLIRKISFTGSTRVGSLLAQQSASTLKKLTMELGGNAPFIVFPDADLKTAVDAAIGAKFRGMGETCICANRFYVHESIIDEFTEMMKERIQQFRIGHGLNEGVNFGCLIDQSSVLKCEKHVSDAIDSGAEVVLKGGRLPEYGPTFYAPVLLKNVAADSLITKQETFGPIVAIIPFKTTEEVIGYANATEFGLASYLCSNNINTIFQMAEALESGIVGCNVGLVSEVSVPFGGIKHSGYGKEGSKYGIEDYMVTKVVYISCTEDRI